MAQLTVREGEIADLVAQGLNNQTIAVKPYVSSCTVESHLSAIHSKADVASGAQPTVHGPIHQIVALWVICGLHG
ncbi:LuxR C-terminal-related transcriptional regulator [Streptomyces sp. NPDC102476]|uniref:LuxR C-terminal-related transcriptional regulator n=1 Tax=Streptomyces sp. NPDC102476 TaxID=3366181 RepID=UPI0037F71E39